MKVLFDTNVIIDALIRREDSNFARRLIQLASIEEIDAYICSKQITDIYYILRKYVTSEEKRRSYIQTILETFKLLPLLPSDLKYCLKTKMNDFEDSLLDEIASVNMINNMVTNNIKDYKNSKSIILTPKQLLDLVAINK